MVFNLKFGICAHVQTMTAVLAMVVYAEYLFFTINTWSYVLHLGWGLHKFKRNNDSNADFYLNQF